MRDIVDEGVQARLNPPADFGAELDRCLEPLREQIRLGNERYEDLLKRYEELVARQGKLKRALIWQLRFIVGILGEVLLMAIWARRLAWNYVAYESLKRSGHSDEKIKERYEAERKASGVERDEIARQVTQITGEKYPME